MPSAKGMFRYGRWVFLLGWMFVLGVMVGRGTIPTILPTQGFQERLAGIVNESEQERVPDQKMDLDFYDALNRPAQKEVVKKIPPQIRHQVKKQVKKEIKKEIKKETPVADPEPIKPAASAKEPPKPEMASIPVKTSKKAQTFKKPDQKAGGSETPKARVSETKPGSAVAPKAVAAKRQVSSQGGYTLQIASFPSFSDAVTYMAKMEEKGIETFRVMTKISGKTWYRVRTGTH